MASLLFEGETWLSPRRVADLDRDMSVLVGGRLFRITLAQDMGNGMKIVAVRTSPLRPFSMQRRKFLLNYEAVLFSGDKA